MIDIDIQQELQYELIDDEKLVWTGRPGTGIIFRKIDIFLIPFSLIWFGMILFVIFGVSTSPSENSNTPWPVFLFLIPFLFAGCYVTFGRFLIDKRRRANTVYGITNDTLQRYQISTFRVDDQKLLPPVWPALSLNFTPTRLYALKKDAVEIYSLR